jgi:hypothetical protein
MIFKRMVADISDERVLSRAKTITVGRKLLKNV